MPSIRLTPVAAALVLLAACGSDDSQAPTLDDLVIEKLPDDSGDQQVGVAGEPLARDLRIRVTRDGEPVEGVTVYWSTYQGTMDPAIDLTGADGTSSSRWTTLYLYLEQEAFAGLEPDTMVRAVSSVLPHQVRFTAIATPDPDAANTVQVTNDRFEPAGITVAIGDTVNWYWLPGSTGHNIVPDEAAPGSSGPPTGYPKFLSFRFMQPGTYRYYCQVHGGPGGAGMAGSVTVRSGDAAD
ncbi:MAG TPA: plastocyanin/azurin family copper-binding protein [Gemmatimonadales bacterium]